MTRSPLMLIALLAAPAVAQEEGQDGQLAFNNHCRTCHSTDEGDNRLGPSLHDIVGREAGSIDGYDYSSALDSSDMVWNSEKLDAFIADPQKVVPGNEMRPFGGIADPEIRSAIVDHLSGEG
jgi:cytochrome c